jgi:hypothetical protein
MLPITTTVANGRDGWIADFLFPQLAAEDRDLI